MAYLPQLIAEVARSHLPDTLDIALYSSWGRVYHGIELYVDDESLVIHNQNASYEDISTAPHILLECVPGGLAAIELLQVHMDYIPAWLPSKFPSLTELRGYSCALTSIPAEVGLCAKLTTLNLFGNKLKSLPRELGPALVCIQKLYLNNNEFREVPPCIADFAGTILEIIICKNMISELPAFLWTLHLLQLFDAGHNKLTRVSRSIGNLVSLKRLELTGNGDLLSLPYTLYHAQGLYVLHCADTQIQELPGTFRLLESLEPSLIDIPIAPLYWHRWYHARFPAGVKRMIRAFYVCNRRFALPYLPDEMLCAIFEFLEYE
jgi:Leucine-rich repeat (LRR) protein